jgi:hypothetical protein
MLERTFQQHDVDLVAVRRRPGIGADHLSVLPV